MIYFTNIFIEKKLDKKNVKENEDNKASRKDLNSIISVFKGDITTLEISAIVNAANKSLLG